jgi:hypothetical protein
VSSTKAPSGNVLVPPPTTTGNRNRFNSSTRPAGFALAASVALRSRGPGPPTPSARRRPRDRGFARVASWRLRRTRASRSGRSCRTSATSRKSDDGSLVRDRVPHGENSVHPPPQKVRPDGPVEVIHERVDLIVRLGPIVAVRVGDVPVERCERRVDQLRHDRTVSRVARARGPERRHVALVPRWDAPARHGSRHARVKRPSGRRSAD